MSAAWRLLADGAGSAAWNMSVDEALLESAADAPATLRLYSWRGPAASLGYRQKPPEWLGRAASLGVEVVRRCSGGGTVLHVGDLTYAVVLPAAHSDVPAGLSDSYEWIRRRLIEGLRAAGLPVEPSRASPEASRSPICFSSPTGAEIDLGRVKLVGSAQRRTPWGVLQHGSIRLGDDSWWYRALLGEEPEFAALGTGVEVADVVRGIVLAFESGLGKAVVPGALSSEETRCAQSREARRAMAALALPSLSPSRPGDGSLLSPAPTCTDTLP